MDREFFYSIMDGEGTLDYEIYLNTKALLSCQKDFKEFCNADEMQFQIVHQVEEMWMKLIGYTLLDIDDWIEKQETNRVITLFRRVHICLRLMIEQLALLETMSPKEYQEIRLRLGNGSGQESPGFRTILRMHTPLWQSFQMHYLDKHELTLEKIYNSEYSHSDAYVVAEAFAEGPRGGLAERRAARPVLPRVMGHPQPDDGPLGRRIWRRARSHRRTLNSNAIEPELPAKNKDRQLEEPVRRDQDPSDSTG